MIKKLLIFTSLLLPAFGDTIQFSWSTIANSSLTLASGTSSAATGSAGVSSVQDLNTGSSLVITNGVFSFTTGTRTTSPGAGGNAILNAGGSWTITGDARIGSNAGLIVVSGLLAAGTFINGPIQGQPNLQNLNGRNTLNADINVTSYSDVMLAYFGLFQVVPNTKTMSLARSGAWNASTGAFTNTGGSVGSPNGTLAFEAATPEPSSYAMLGLGLGALALLRRRRK